MYRKNGGSTKVKNNYNKIAARKTKLQNGQTKETSRKEKKQSVRTTNEHTTKTWSYKGHTHEQIKHERQYIAKTAEVPRAKTPATK